MLIHMLTGADKKCAHDVRDVLRGEQYLRVEDRRSDFEGLAFYGLDRSKSAVLTNGKLRGLETYQVRCFQTGATPTMDRLFRAQKVDSPGCHCGAEKETWRHVVDECPAYEHLRCREMSRAQWLSLPGCLRLHGLMPAKLEAFEEPLPDRYGGRNGVTALVGDVQYCLLDMLSCRAALFGLQVPVARW